MTDNNKPIKAIVEKIIVKHEIDEYPDLSFLGKFSDNPGKYPIKHNGSRGSYHYFNADNVENMTQAKENYNEMMRFENNDIFMMGIKAYAVINIPTDNNSWIIQHITSGGLWGIESNSDKDYIKTIESEQIDEVKTYLKILCVENIDNAPIEYKND